VLSALNAASTGTHALENAANTVSGIIGEEPSTLMKLMKPSLVSF